MSCPKEMQSKQLLEESGAASLWRLKTCALWLLLLGAPKIGEKELLSCTTDSYDMRTGFLYSGEWGSFKRCGIILILASQLHFFVLNTFFFFSHSILKTEVQDFYSYLS